MELVTDLETIRYLQRQYAIERRGRLVGIENSQTAWFISEDEQKYWLCKIDRDGRWMQPRLYSINY